MHRYIFDRYIDISHKIYTYWNLMVLKYEEQPVIYYKYYIEVPHIPHIPGPFFVYKFRNSRHFSYKQISNFGNLFQFDRPKKNRYQLTCATRFAVSILSCSFLYIFNDFTYLSYAAHQCLFLIFIKLWHFSWIRTI